MPIGLFDHPASHSIEPATLFGRCGCQIQLVLDRLREDLTGAVVEPGAQVVLGVFGAGKDRLDHLAGLRGHLGPALVGVHLAGPLDRLEKRGAHLGEPVEGQTTDASSAVLDRWLIPEALSGLSLEHRTVISAAYYEGRSVADISARLRIPEGTVKSRLHYGLSTLKLILQEKGVTRS